MTAFFCADLLLCQKIAAGVTGAVKGDSVSDAGDYFSGGMNSTPVRLPW